MFPNLTANLSRRVLIFTEKLKTRSFRCVECRFGIQDATARCVLTAKVEMCSKSCLISLRDLFIRAEHAERKVFFMEKGRMEERGGEI